MSDTTAKRFWSKVDAKTDGCWNWQAAISGGYGRFYAHGRLVQAHRWAYETLIGPIPEGLQLDHLCRNQRCVNPQHLDPVTPRENSRRGLKGDLKTHCPQGHPVTPENTKRTAAGHRHCRICIRDWSAFYGARRCLPGAHGCTACGRSFASELSLQVHQTKKHPGAFPKPTCSIDGCDGPRHTRGWCEAHYTRWRRANPKDMVTQ